MERGEQARKMDKKLTIQVVGLVAVGEARCMAVRRRTRPSTGRCRRGGGDEGAMRNPGSGGDASVFAAHTL